MTTDPRKIKKIDIKETSGDEKIPLECNMIDDETPTGGQLKLNIDAGSKFKDER